LKNFVYILYNFIYNSEKKKDIKPEVAENPLKSKQKIKTF